MFKWSKGWGKGQGEITFTDSGSSAMCGVWTHLWRRWWRGCKNSM